MLPEHVGTIGAMATVGLSQDLFDSALLLLQKAGALNLDITGQLVRGGPAAQGAGDRCLSLGRPHRSQIMGGWGSGSFGATEGLLEGLNGSCGEARGCVAWGVAALKPVMAWGAGFRSRMTTH